jgi:hypothetical protein
MQLVIEKKQPHVTQKVQGLISVPADQASIMA